MASPPCPAVSAGYQLGCVALSPHSFSSSSGLGWALQGMAGEGSKRSVPKNVSFSVESTNQAFAFVTFADILSPRPSHGQAQSHCGRGPKLHPLVGVMKTICGHF